MTDIEDQIEELLGRLVDELERLHKAGSLSLKEEFMNQSIGCGGFSVEKGFSALGSSYFLEVDNTSHHLKGLLAHRVDVVFKAMEGAAARWQKDRELKSLKSVVDGIGK